MTLTSTNNTAAQYNWSQSVLQGLASDGGLLVPTSLPRLGEAQLQDLRGMPFNEMATTVLSEFLYPAVPLSVLRTICDESFNFPIPLVAIDKSTFILELFHGPTAAFKDFGARFMSRLFRFFLGVPTRPLTVLTATSGDTGSAVAHAFLDSSQNPTIRVVVLYPKGRVSPLQERQMTTLGHNIIALEVDGTFDDCQRVVKEALSSHEIARHHQLTSANSINIARLLPQALYYLYAWGKLPIGAAPIFSVPSGNLGNLTGGLLAHRLGMPASKFVAACNSNDAFPKYLKGSSYTPHASIETISNAMDVGNPSNFARILHLFDGDQSRIQEMIVGYSFSDDATLSEIARTFREVHYTLDPHTAVGMLGLKRYRASTDGMAENMPGIVLSTAHPAKFSSAIERAISITPSLPPQLHACMHGLVVKRPLQPTLPALVSVLES